MEPLTKLKEVSKEVLVVESLDILSQTTTFSPILWITIPLLAAVLEIIDVPSFTLSIVAISPTLQPKSIEIELNNAALRMVNNVALRMLIILLWSRPTISSIIGRPKDMRYEKKG
ncbi:MAG: hypothetical protein EBT51_11615 [Flavobacteriaceae bacterium]|nr:hypothetical protein [Flavobacteriaceae bacterium]